MFVGMTSVVATKELAEKSVPPTVSTNAMEQRNELFALVVGQPVEHRTLRLFNGRTGIGEQAFALFRQRRVDNTAVLVVARTLHQTSSIEPVEHSGHIRTRRRQMLAKFTAAGTAVSVALDYLQQLELRGGHVERLERPRQRPFYVSTRGTQRVHRERGGGGGY